MKSAKSGDQLFLVKKSARLTGLLLLIVLFCGPLYPAADLEESSFRSLKKSFSTGDKEAFGRDASLFLKKYPGSIHIPEVKLLLADREGDADLAVEKYRSVIKNYSRFKGREYALYKICQILDLKSRWKELLTESASGIKQFPDGNYFNDFKFMHITALIMLENYDAARSESVRLTERTHNFEALSMALFLLAETEKKISGNSKPYISNLKELATGFGKSEIYPSIIFRLALFYDEKKDYDRAYSAYSDIVELFPDSPEADISIQNIGKLKKLNPNKVAYLPDNLTVKNTDDLDLSPETEVKHQTDENYYSVAIGPYTRSADTNSTVRILKNYDFVNKVKTAYGYMIYLGRYANSENALETRIRLAEEYGINGNIVRVSVHDKKSYIYEDR